MEKPIEKLTIDDALNALKVIKEFCTINEESCMNCPFRANFRANNNDGCALGYEAPASWELNENKVYVPRLIL